MAKGVPSKGPLKQDAAGRPPKEAPAAEDGQQSRPPRKPASRPPRGEPPAPAARAAPAGHPGKGAERKAGAGRAGGGKRRSRPAPEAQARAAGPVAEAPPPPAGPQVAAPAGPLPDTTREAEAEPQVAPGAGEQAAVAETAAETVTVAPGGAAAEPEPAEAPPAPRAPQLHVVPDTVTTALAPGGVDFDEAEVVEEREGAPRGREGWRGRAFGALALARGVAAQTLGSPALREAAQAAQGLVKAVRSGLGAGGSRAVDAYGRDEDLVRELSPLADFLYKRYWRVTVQGAELVPSGPVLLVANHSGAVPYDGPVLQQALRRERPELPEARWLVEDQIFYAPFFGTLFNRLGALRASPENALRLLEEGRPVIVFPEGVQGLGKLFSERYRLKRFGRGGFVKLALRARVPIVPVAIVGAEEATPLLAKLPGSLFGLPYVPLTPLGPVPLPARWTVRFGAPVDLEGHGPEDAHTLAVVQRLSERTRDTIQGMLESILRERTRVFGR